MQMTSKQLGAGPRALRLGAALAIALAAANLGGCSLWNRVKPGSTTGAEVKDPPGSKDPYPHIGEVPEKPKLAESTDSRNEIARSLIADRNAANYTDQSLRGGTEPSAPPPPAPVASLSDSQSDTAAVKMANKGETKKPGFFGRLFGAKEETPANPAGPAPLPAQPTSPVDVQQAPPAK